MRSDQSLRVLRPAHGLAYLGHNDDRQGDSGADQPLPEVEPGGLHHGVEYAQDGGQDQQDERHGGGDGEAHIDQRASRLNVGGLTPPRR